MADYTPEAEAIHRKRHLGYVYAGGCPSVHGYKAWCNERIRTPHSTHTAGGISPEYRLRWTDAEAARCPCGAELEDLLGEFRRYGYVAGMAVVEVLLA